MDLMRQIETIVGANNASNKPFDLWTYSKDASVVEGNIPGFVVMPKTVEEVQAIMKLADDTKTPVFPRGSGTSLWGAVPAKGAIVIDMAKMSEVKKVDEEVLTCVTEPGITFGELDSVLNKSGYRFLVAPENSMSGTVGGHFASHGSGTGSVTYGLQGDCVIGLKVVLPNGELLATGSAAHPHNPRHYARYAYANDLTGLFCGSEGTLGTFTEVALKIEKVPEAIEFAEFRFDSFELAFAAREVARKQRIPFIKTDMRGGEFMDRIDPKRSPHPPVSLLFGIEGNADVIGIYKKRLLDIVQKHGGEYIGGEESARAAYMDRWRVSGIMLTHGVRIHLPVLFPSGKEAPIFIHRIGEVARKLEEQYKVWVYHGAGFGIDRGWLMGIGVVYDESDPVQWENARQAGRKLTEEAYKLGASPYRVGTYWDEYMRQLGPHYDVLKKIKHALDPNNIMSPGVLGL